MSSSLAKPEGLCSARSLTTAPEIEKKKVSSQGKKESQQLEGGKGVSGEKKNADGGSGGSGGNSIR